MSVRNKELDLARRKIFIGGLSYGTDDGKLRSYFSKFGTVHDAVVMKDPVSCRSRGFGFITFEDIDSVDSVLENEPHMIDSRKVEAKRAVPKAESTDSATGSNSNVASTNATTNANSNSSKNSSINSLGRPPSIASGAVKSSVKSVGSNHIQADSANKNGSSQKANNSNNSSHPITSSSSSTGSISGSSNSSVNNNRYQDDANGYLKIFVGGLHYDTRDADFRAYFEKYGKVQYAEVMFNRETHKSRGFGFIIFESEDSVDSVCDEREHVIDAKVVEVKRAIPRSKFPNQGSSSPQSNQNRVVAAKSVGPVRTTAGASKPPVSSKPLGSSIVPSKAVAVSTTTPLSNPASSWAALVKRSDHISGSYSKPENNVYLDNTVTSAVNHNSPSNNPPASPVNNVVSISPAVETRSVRSASEGGDRFLAGDISDNTGSNVVHQSGYSSEPNTSSGLLRQSQSSRNAAVELSPQQQQQMMSARSPQQYVSTTSSVIGSAPTSDFPPMMNLPPMQQQQQDQIDNSIFGAAAGGNLNPAAASFSFTPGLNYTPEQSQTFPSFGTKSSDVTPFWSGGSGAELGYPPQPTYPSFSQQMMWNGANRGSGTMKSSDDTLNSIKNNDSHSTELDDILMMQNFNGLNMLDRSESGSRNNLL